MCVRIILESGRMRNLIVRRNGRNHPVRIIREAVRGTRMEGMMCTTDLIRIRRTYIIRTRRFTIAIIRRALRRTGRISGVRL